MPYEQEPGSGSMWYNDRADSNPKAPKWSGKVVIPEGYGGKTMDIAAWHNAGTDNKMERWSIKLSDPWQPQSGGSTYNSNDSKWMKPAPVTKTEDGEEFPF